MDAKETNIFYLVLILILGVGIVIYYFFSSIQKQHRRILALKSKNLISELKSIEAERKRIAADLHDGISPMISAVKLKISSFELSDPEDVIQRARTKDHLTEILQQLRSISFNLMPVTLTRKGLKAALNEFINYSADHNNLTIQLNVDNSRFTEDQSIHLYRIIQEIIQNTSKHAEAKNLSIDLRQFENQIILVTSDDGKGFDYSRKLNEDGGFGLRNLLSRADVLGGRLFVESKISIGTKYRIEFPV